MTTMPGTARKMSTYAVARPRTGVKRGPGSPRRIATRRPSGRIRASAMRNSLTFVQKALIRPGRLAQKIGPLKKSFWTSAQFGAWTMIHESPPRTTTVLITAVAVARHDVFDLRCGTSVAGEIGGTDEGPRAVTCGPPDRSWRGGTAGGYGVKTGADALSESPSFVIAARLPSSVIALIAALTHGGMGRGLARTALTCSAEAPAGGAN